jgi:hypothetical protein
MAGKTQLKTIDMSGYKDRMSPSGIILSGPLTIFKSETDKKKALGHAKLHSRTPKAPDTSFLCSAVKGSQISKKANYIAGVCPSKHKVALNGSKTATTGISKPVKTKPTPGVTGVFTRDGGFELVPFVKSQAEVNQKITAGKLSPASKIAYRDSKGQVHTGTVMELHKIMPKA